MICKYLALLCSLVMSPRGGYKLELYPLHMKIWTITIFPTHTAAMRLQFLTRMHFSMMSSVYLLTICLWGEVHLSSIQMDTLTGCTAIPPCTPWMHPYWYTYIDSPPGCTPSPGCTWLDVTQMDASPLPPPIPLWR